MKKRRKLTALILVCLLLPGISGCARQREKEVLIPVSVRTHDYRSDLSNEQIKEATGEDANRHAGGYDFVYNEDHVLQKIVGIDRNNKVTGEVAVTADEEGRIISLQSDSGDLPVTSVQETYTWTSMGNLLTHTRVDGKGEQVLHREYDTKNRILSVVLTAPGKENVIAYEYSKEGQLRVARHYDEEALLCRTEFSYGEDGRLTKETLLDTKDEVRATAVYEYTADGFTKVTVTRQALISSQPTIYPDGSSHTTSIPPYIGEVTIVYTYDKAGFLIEEFHGEGNRNNLRYEYTYIAVSEKNTSRVFPLCSMLPATGILDQLTF